MTSDVISAILAIATFIYVFLTFKILKANELSISVMRESIASTQRVADHQHLLSVIEIIQKEDVRKARADVLTSGRIGAVAWEELTDSERADVTLVCSSYDVVGIMVRNGVVPQDILLDNWGPSIRRTFNRLSPYIIVLRSAMGSAIYWDDFEWLADQVPVVN